jgi:hypothetical protein
MYLDNKKKTLSYVLGSHFPTVIHFHFQNVKGVDWFFKIFQESNYGNKTKMA